MPARLPFLDAARGMAVVAMIAYHFFWDLSVFGFIQTDVGREWRGAAMTIAASFLLISGAAFTLAGRLKPRRLAVIGGAAALVSLGSWWFDPGSFIFFGILHCIALSAVLAVPFLRAPAWVLGVAAALVLALGSLAHPAFNAWPLLWLGLATQLPPTNDYIPIFPWFGFVLVGMLAGRAPRDLWPEAAPALLVWLGRWSLLIYLVHQPILVGLLNLLRAA